MNIGASRVIIVSGERVLLGKRASGIEEGKWNIPGGKIDDGESAIQAAYREIKEETGLELEQLDHLFEDHFNGWISHYFLANLSDTCQVEPSDLDEHSDFFWFSEDELKEIVHLCAFNHYVVLTTFFSEKMREK